MFHGSSGIFIKGIFLIFLLVRLNQGRVQSQGDPLETQCGAPYRVINPRSLRNSPSSLTTSKKKTPTVPLAAGCPCLAVWHLMQRGFIVPHPSWNSPGTNQQFHIFSLKWFVWKPLDARKWGVREMFSLSLSKEEVIFYLYSLIGDI